MLQFTVEKRAIEEKKPGRQAIPESVMPRRCTTAAASSFGGVKLPDLPEFETNQVAAL